MPGVLVLVVGPSGAGKDTLIDRARQTVGEEQRVHFVRRLITREAGSVGEDHEPCSEAEFDRTEASGGLILSWRAHGLSYGIPARIRTRLVAGEIVVANVSRSVIPAAEALGVPILVLNVTASPAILAARLAGRGRETPEDIERRLAREAPVVTKRARVVTVRNETTIDEAADAFVVALRNARLSEPTA